MRLRALLVLVLTAPAVSAQQRQPGPPPPQDPHAATAALLRSADATEQAWGAWYAGRDQLRQFVSEVQQVVMGRLGDETVAGHAAVSIALDALIQLKASVDAGTLPVIYERRPVHALILASLGSGDRKAFLHDVLSTVEDGDSWAAAANLLLKEDPSGLAEALVSGLKIEATLYLISKEGDGFGRGRGVGGSVGCGFGGPAEGLPPWAAYDLSSYGNPGLTVLSTGPTTVYYRRILGTAGQYPAFCDGSRSLPDLTERLEYLASLVATPAEQLPLHAYNDRTVVLQSGQEPSSELARLREDLTRQYERLLQLLVSRQLLDPVTAQTIKPVIEIEIEDRRSPH